MVFFEQSMNKFIEIFGDSHWFFISPEQTTPNFHDNTEKIPPARNFGLREFMYIIQKILRILAQYIASLWSIHDGWKESSSWLLEFEGRTQQTNDDKRMQSLTKTSGDVIRRRFRVGWELRCSFVTDPFGKASEVATFKRITGLLLRKWFQAKSDVDNPRKATHHAPFILHELRTHDTIAAILRHRGAPQTFFAAHPFEMIPGIESVELVRSLMIAIANVPWTIVCDLSIEVGCDLFWMRNC